MKNKWFGDLVSKKVKKGAGKGLYKAAEHVLEHSNRTVPKDEGNLLSSGFTDIDYKILTAAVIYDTEYAVRLHESTPGEYNFRGTGRRKWLELTVKERQKAVSKVVADEIKKVT